MVHRYPDRALLKPLLTCPVYCRFCFRREMIGPGARACRCSEAELQAAGSAARRAAEIREVILTGGDPLMLSPRRLWLMARLAAIPHVEIIRIHTRPRRRPVARNAGAGGRLKRRQGLFPVLHANHARELSPAARAACALLVDAGAPMLSQSVLLAGVNDDATTLGALMRTLVECRIKPYYLHHADLAPARRTCEHPSGAARS